MRNCFICLICLLFAGATTVAAQDIIGTPSIVNYTKEIYNAGNQNWDITQDKRGIMYFANNDGMLTFDGVRWEVYKLPNGTGLHSVMVDEDGKIFVGGQGEIGYFESDENGRLQYHTLNQLVPASHNTFADVWNICKSGEDVFFRVNAKILHLKKDKIIVYPGTYWSFLGEAGDKIYAHDADKGIVEYEKDNWVPVRWGNDLPKGAVVRSVLSLNKDSLLIATSQFGAFILDQKGLRPFSSPVLNEISSKIIYQVLLLPNKNIALATRLGGCYIVDTKGNLVERITKNEGLQSQNTLSIMSDDKGNLWLGLDNGIDLVAYNDAVKHIFPEKENHNTGYASVYHKGNLYLGTSAGVYFTPLKKEGDFSRERGQFKLVKNSKGEIWGLSVVDDKLLIAHAAAAYYVNQETAELLDMRIGYWGFQSYENNVNNTAIAGTYNSVSFFDMSVGLPKVKQIVYTESARFIVQYNGVIWVGHPYRGLFRVIEDDNKQLVSRQYLDKQGIISNNHNRIFKIRDKLVLTNENGIFEFNEENDHFVKSEFYQNIFKGELVSYLMEDRYGNIWFTQDKRIGVVAKSQNFSKLTYFRELENKFTFNFEHINVLDSSNVIIAAEKGFFHLNLASYIGDENKPKVLIRSLKTLVDGNDSLFYGGYGENISKPAIQFNKAGIYLSFAAVEYSHPGDIEYSYYLEGFDKQWSAWGIKTDKEFANLPAGSYTFHVKCRYGNEESLTASYSFEILPPWYKSWWAILVYVLSGVGLLFLILNYQQQQHFKQQHKRLLQQQHEHEEKQRNLTLQHQLEVQENEKKIVELTNEKLQVELDHKNKEMASSAMNLVRKVEVMSMLKESLQSYKQMTDTEKSGKEFQKIIKTIDKELDNQHEWEQFAVHFDKVHNNYLQNLKAAFPSLSGNDLKLCAYLKLNISTKEIAQLMNISVRGVETARFRLRKKLSLPGDTNLADFLIGLQGKE